MDSQSGNDSILERLAKDLDFKYALFGDKTITIAPVKPPPSKSFTELWLQKRNIYRDLKLKINGNIGKNDKQQREIIKNGVNEKIPEQNVPRKDTVLKIQSADNLYDSKKGSSCDKAILTSWKSEPTKEVSFSDKVDKFSLTKSLSEPFPTKEEEVYSSQKKRNLPGSPSNEDSVTHDVDEDIISPSPPKVHVKPTSKDRICFSQRLAKRVRLSQSDSIVSSPTLSGMSADINSQETPSVSTPKSGSTPVTGMHSTPLRIKRLDKLFQASFTPISKDRSEEKSQVVHSGKKEPGFITPKKIPLPTRLSINTVNRKLISSAQVGVIYKST